jgi:lipocalin
MVMTVAVAPLPTQDWVDLERYAGRWYEIARLPNRFQERCAGDVAATYTLRPELDAATYDSLVASAASLGFGVSRLKRTAQSPARDSAH